LQRFILAKRRQLLFLLAAGAAYLYGLGNFPFVGPDEPRYAQVAREMFTRGDLITPTLGGHTWFEKPALPYWTMHAAYRLFGVSEWSARLSFALSGLMTVLVIYWTGARAERRQQQQAGTDEEGLEWLAVASGVVGASCAGLLLFSHGVNFDIPLTLTTTFALACFFIHELEEEKRHGLWPLVGFYAGMGAALLAKGLIGFILTFGVVTSYHLLRRAWPKREAALSILWGVPLAVCVAAAWYAPVIARHGWAFVDEFFIQHHFARYTSNRYHHPQPFYFYVPIIMLMALPWTPYLIEALFGARRWRWRADDAVSKWRVFGLAWLVVPILFFSASGSKLPGYILPALPGAVMLMGERLARAIRGQGGLRSARVAGALMVLLGLGVAVYLWRESYAVRGCAAASAAFLLAGGLIALVRAKRGWLSVTALACAMFLMVVVGLACGVRDVAQRISSAHAFEAARARGYDHAPVYHLHTIERTAEYYAAGRLRYGADGEPLRFEGATQVEGAARESGSPILVLVPSEYSSQLTTYAPLETEIIDDNGEVSLIAVRIRK
jgi:4-amino-4-deoxy-L-arabinose transferase-like glycosyltransferase